jgi:hypothetical protein
MEQLKFALGPYELFAAIIGGFPFLLAGVLIYHPIASLQSLVPVIQNNATVAIAITVVFLSYILGGSVQGMSWRYFLALCKLFKRDHRYFGDVLNPKDPAAVQRASHFDRMTFEERLGHLLQKKLGVAASGDRLDTLLMPYLRQHNLQSVMVAESHLATHIMYRSLSLGMLLIGFILVINLFRVQTLSFEQWILPLIAIAFAYITFHRAVTFKRWHNREILLGFYFTALPKELSP